VTHQVAFHRAPHLLAHHAAVHHHQIMTNVVRVVYEVPVKVVYQPVAAASAPLQVDFHAVSLQVAHLKVQNQAVYHVLQFQLHI